MDDHHDLQHQDSPPLVGDPQQLWLKAIENELHPKDGYGGSFPFNAPLIGHTIFRVPEPLRKINPLAYLPLVLAIGPYLKTRKLQPSVTENFMKISSAKILLPLLNLGLDDFHIFASKRAEVGSYLALMDDLIDNADDVQVLRSSGVLVHSLRNDEEVAKMWNNMCTNLQVLYETPTLAEAYSGIKDHLSCRLRYKMMWELYAQFSDRYLSAPWLTTSVLAATLLLLLTIIQTSYSIANYYKV